MQTGRQKRLLLGAVVIAVFGQEQYFATPV
jgi:hypothetical protein